MNETEKYEKHREAVKRYEQSNKGKETAKRYQQSHKGQLNIERTRIRRLCRLDGLMEAEIDRVLRNRGLK